MSLTPARRKKLQRDRDRALGFVEVTVKVGQEHVQSVRDFAASLPIPSPPVDPDQLDLIDRIDQQMQLGSDGQTDLFDGEDKL